MTMQALRARCRHCGGELYLYELREQATGLCPRCQVPLSPDWTRELIFWAKHVEDLESQLVRSLRRLVGFPGNLDLIPASVLEPILDEAGWEQDLAFEPGDAIASGAALESTAMRWEREAAQVSKALRSRSTVLDGSPHRPVR